MNMLRVPCAFYLLLASMAIAAPRLILAPYAWLPEDAPVEVWAAVEGERDSCEGWTYQWNFTMPEGVSREKVRGYVLNTFEGFALDENAFSLTGKVNDSWSILTRQIFKKGAGTGTVRIQATLTLTSPDGETIAASRVYELGRNVEDSAELTMEKRRKFAVLSGLHWLQRRQRPKGGWGGDILCPAYHRGDLFDYKDIDKALDIELFYNEDGAPDFREVIRESEYYDNYLSMVASACALWAFGNCGYGLDRQENNPFIGTVRAGIAHIGGRCSTLLLAGLQELGLDENRNGRGAALGEDEQYRGYVQPMVIASIMAACPPNAEIVMPEGKCTAKELVQDAFDYLGWCLFYYGKSSWPYNYRSNAGFDLSIAGWNFLALEALPNWGISVPSSVISEVLRLLYRNEDILEGGFGYSSSDGNKTIALTSAAIMGLSLASSVDPGKDAVHLCPQEKRFAGELYLNAMRHLPVIMKKQDDYLDIGYFQWTLIRMLQSEKIDSIVSIGKAINWRYADMDSGGLWDRILSLQMFDGRWMFPEALFSFGYYNDELETAYMLLSLSDELVRKTAVIGDLNVVARVPAGIGEGMLRTDFTDLAFNGDEAELSYYRGVWDQASPITLTLDYLLPGGDAGDVLVQKNAEATYVNVLGELESVEDGALHASRKGETFDLELVLPPEAARGDIVPIAVNVQLPDGDGFRVVTISPGYDECVLEYDEAVRWTRMRLYPDDAPLPELGYRAMPSSERWIVPSVTLEDGCASFHNAQGHALKVACIVSEDAKALVYHISSEYSVLLEIDGSRHINERMDEDFCGGVYEMQRHWDTGDLEAGNHLVRAVLLKNGEPLLERAGSIRLLAHDEYELLGTVDADSDVYLPAAEAHITSSVMRIVGDGTGDSADVVLSVATDDASDVLEEWSISNLGATSFWQRDVPMYPIDVGTYVISQSVSSTDGRVWNSSTTFSVKEAIVEEEQASEEDEDNETGTDDGMTDGVNDEEEHTQDVDEKTHDEEGEKEEEDSDEAEDVPADKKDSTFTVTGRKRRWSRLVRKAGKNDGDNIEAEEISQEWQMPSPIYEGTQLANPNFEVSEVGLSGIPLDGEGGAPARRLGKIYEIASISEKKAPNVVGLAAGHDAIGNVAFPEQKASSFERDYEIHSLETLRLGGLWNIYGRNCHIFAGKASVAKPYRDISIQPSVHNMLEKHRRLLSSMRQNAVCCEGDLLVERGWMLKSGIYFVTGDIRFYGGALGPVSLICGGKAILRGCGKFAPHSENVLVLARKGIFVLGEEAKYEGDLCSLESEVRVLGSWLTFANGGIYGRRVGVYGSNNAFLGRQ